MKAYVYTAPYTIECKEVETPVPGPGEVRVKVKAVSICGSDTGGFKGTSSMRVAPLVMGHEFSGIVDMVGEGVTDVAIGTRTVIYPNIYCGKCSNCKAGLPNICDNRFIIGTTMPAGSYNGAMAEYVIAPATKVMVLDDSISFVEGSLYEPISVALRGSKKLGDITGKTVTVFGSGPIGLLTVKCLKYLGAGTVIAMDIIDERLAVAKEVGADYVINTQNEDAIAKVKELTHGEGADAAADCVGISTSLNSSIKMVRNGSRVVLIGMASEAVEGFIYKHVVSHEIELVGSYCYVDELYEIGGLFKSGKFDVDKIVTCVAPIEKCAEKIAELASGKSKEVKVVLTYE